MKKLLRKYAAYNLYKHGGKINNPKFKKFALVAVIMGIIVFIIAIIVIVFVVVRAWDATTTTVNQNPTFNALIENTKEEVGNLLPTVPSSAQDFIANNQIDTAKLTETYNNLPAATQQVWKEAMTRSINESINNATGTDLNTLQNLLQTVQAL